MKGLGTILAGVVVGFFLGVTFPGGPAPLWVIFFAVPFVVAGAFLAGTIDAE